MVPTEWLLRHGGKNYWKMIIMTLYFIILNRFTYYVEHNVLDVYRDMRKLVQRKMAVFMPIKILLRISAAYLKLEILLSLT